MKHPMFIDAAEESSEGGGDALSKLTTPETLNQTFLIIPAKLRLVTLASFIVWKCRLSRRHNKRKILVFMSTQDMVDFHANLLNRSLNNSNAERIDFLTLHGSMSQQERVAVFHKFRGTNKQGENDLASVLVCTDVASRGLDLPSAVDWVVQYNAPVTRADYIHRVGRTARAGAGGSSLLMLLPSEAEFVRELEQENLPLAEMTAEHALEKLPRDESLIPPEHGRRPPTMEEAATGLQLSMENSVVADEELHKLASQAYVSFIRSYASYPKEVRHVFCFKELHLGHLAKSFALRDPPSQITGIGKGQWVKNDARKRRENREMERQKNMEIKQASTMYNSGTLENQTLFINHLCLHCKC